MSGINQQLLNYVQDALRKGHDINTVKDWLLKNGTNPREIDEVIRLVSPNIVNTVPSNPMMEMQLRNYVQQQLRNGYAAEMIRLTLIKQGYNAFIVDKVLNENVNINIRHEVHVAGKTIFGIMFSLLIMGGLVYLIFFSNLLFNKDIPLLDVSIESGQESYYAGDTITYNIELISTGSQKRFDANVRYVILDENDAVKKSYSETIAVETRTMSSGSINIPSTLEPGRYYLKAIVDYGAEMPASSIKEFNIIAKTDNEQPIVILPDGNISDTPINNQDNQNGQNTQRPSGKKQTFGEILVIVRQQAKVTPSVALRICDRANAQDQKDICYSTVAEQSKNPSYCGGIIGTEYKDNCYLYFIVDGDTEVCDKIINNNTKAFCNQLRIVELMQQYYLQNNTQAIIELNKQFEPNIYSNVPMPANYQQTYSQPSTITVDDFAIRAELNVSNNVNSSNNDSNNNITG